MGLRSRCWTVPLRPGAHSPRRCFSFLLFLISCGRHAAHTPQREGLAVTLAILGQRVAKSLDPFLQQTPSCDAGHLQTAAVEYKVFLRFRVVGRSELCELHVMMFCLRSAVRFTVKFLGFAIVFSNAVESALLLDCFVFLPLFSTDFFFSGTLWSSSNPSQLRCVFISMLYR